MVSELPFVRPFEEKRREAELSRNREIEAAKRTSRTTRRSTSAAAQPHVELNPWWTQTVYHATGTMHAHGLMAGETTASFLASDASRGIIYSPETVARPDGVLMLDRQHAVVLGITIWSDTVPSEKVRSQIRSTDLSKAFFTADGLGVNENCASQRTEWESQRLHEIQAVRIHVALPFFTTDAPAGEPIRSSNDLGVHLDRTNCHLLFGEDEIASALYDVLAIATNTKRADWRAYVGVREFQS